MDKSEYDVLCKESIEKMIKLNDAYLECTTEHKKLKFIELAALRREFSELVTSFHPVKKSNIQVEYMIDRRTKKASN